VAGASIAAIDPDVVAETDLPGVGEEVVSTGAWTIMSAMAMVELLAAACNTDHVCFWDGCTNEVEKIMCALEGVAWVGVRKGRHT